MLIIDGTNIPGEFMVQEGINMYSFSIKSIEPWGKKILTGAGSSNILMPFRYTSDDLQYVDNTCVRRLNAQSVCLVTCFVLKEKLRT